MSRGVMVLVVIAAVASIIAITFAMSYVSIQHKRLFKPMSENVDRRVFENTQSYVLGKVQALARYKAEYDRTASVQSKEAIRATIRMEFAQFESNKVQDASLRVFLVTMRGF